jgi:Alcohol dehydrogenase GroES-like domain
MVRRHFFYRRSWQGWNNSLTRVECTRLGDWPVPVKLPLIGGHEGAGEIVAIAEHSDTHLKVGDRVGIKWIGDSCLHCEYCQKGQEPLCPAAKCSGYSIDGSFQQYAVSYTRALSRIPDGLSLEDAAPIRTSLVPSDPCADSLIRAICRCVDSLCRCDRLQGTQGIRNPSG